LNYARSALRPAKDSIGSRRVQQDATGFLLLPKGGCTIFLLVRQVEVSIVADGSGGGTPAVDLWASCDNP